MFRRGKGVFSKRNVLFIRERRTGYKTVRRYGSKLVLKAMEAKNKSLLSKEKKMFIYFFSFFVRNLALKRQPFSREERFSDICAGKTMDWGAVSYNENLTSQF